MSEASGQDLRALLLRQTPADLKLAPTTELPHVWAVLMEWEMSPGSVIGGGEHESVREMSRKFLATVEKFLDAGAFVVRDKPIDVAKSAVSFTVLTYEGIRVARDTEKRLEKRESPIWPLFFIGHDVIAKVRGVSQGRSGG